MTIENLTNLSDKVLNELNLNKQLNEEVLELERKYLEKVIKITFKGISYQKIVVKDKYPHVEYYRNEEGKLVKGILLDEFNIVKRDAIFTPEEFICGRREDKELFLMEDGSLNIFDYIEDGPDEYNDKICKRSISKQQSLKGFDIDEAVETIAKNLETRLKKLGVRNKAQLTRLEKLKQLQL